MMLNHLRVITLVITQTDRVIMETHESKFAHNLSQCKSSLIAAVRAGLATKKT